MSGSESEAKGLLEAGELAAAVAAAGRDVKARPLDVRARTFLFELLCFAGDFDRAARQLDVLAQQDVSAEAGVQVYRNVLAAERARRRLWSDGLRPTFVTAEPAYAHLHLDCIGRLREGRGEEGRALLEEAIATYPESSGTLNGEAFADFGDGDPVLGPFLEVFVREQYVWLPFEAIRRIEIEPPKRLRDLLWIRAEVTGWEHPFGEVLVPVLYAGSSEHADDRVRLGRMTDWRPAAGGPVVGAGQRTLVADDREWAILEVREIEFAKNGAGE